MRRWRAYRAVLVAGALLLAPIPGFAAGVCLEATDGCNDFYLEVSPLTADLYQVNGYEYGCGRDTDLASGTMRVHQGTLYIGLTGSHGGEFDSGAVYQRNYVIDVATNAGRYESLYTYVEGGLLQATPGNGSAVIYPCDDPAGPVEGVARSGELDGRESDGR